MSSLIDKPTGFCGPIQALEGDAVLVERLYEIGLTPHEWVKIKQKMVLQGPLIIGFRQATFALRREEAQCIKV
ncbi:MAG: FeoA family protein [Bdellovibrionota bacterium]